MFIQDGYLYQSVPLLTAKIDGQDKRKGLRFDAMFSAVQPYIVYCFDIWTGNLQDQILMYLKSYYMHNQGTLIPGPGILKVKNLKSL